MKTWQVCGSALIGVVLMNATSEAQPGAGAGAGAGQAGATAAAGATTATATATSSPTTLWSFLGLSRQNLTNLKVRFCQSNIGQLAGNSLKPASAFSGGLLPQCCPKALTDDTLAKAEAQEKLDPGSTKGSATVAAAKIMKDEAEAKQRRAAVRYLGTVDCHYWGEVAEPALIKALRADKNECVRFEAALALLNGCCCTKPVIVSLTISVYGVDTIRETEKRVKVRETRAGEFADNAPSETSERVKAAAYAALQNCLSCYNEPVAPAGPERTKPRPEPVPEPTKPVAGTLPGTLTGMETEYQMTGQERTLGQVVAEARRISTHYSPATASISLPTGSHSISQIIAQAAKPARGPETMPLMQADSMPTNGHIQQASASNLDKNSSREPLPLSSQSRYGGLIPWLSR